MVEKYISKTNKPTITKEEVNKEIFQRHFNFDGKQLYIRIPKKVSNILNLKNRQKIEFIVDYSKKIILLNIKDVIVDKTKRKSNLVKKK